MKKIKYRHFKKINNGHEVTQQIRTKKTHKMHRKKRGKQSNSVYITINNLEHTVRTISSR